MGWEANLTHQYALVWNERRYPVNEVVRIATGVKGLIGTQARSYLQRRGFAVVPLRAEPSHVWLFQANPRFYDLAERVGQASVGDEDIWTVTLYRDEMQPGDRVLLWLSGTNAGIYAIGELTGKPQERTYTDEAPPWLDDKGPLPITVWQVPFRYIQLLPQPIRKTTLQEHPILKNLHVLRFAPGTNFRVTTAEWEAMRELIERQPIDRSLRRQEPIYSLEACAADTGIDIESLTRWLGALRRKGQAVIYGPPGTGKTFVAGHLARHLVGGGEGFSELVQFHPAYTYEDFIQGIRPEVEDKVLTYPLKRGRFLDFCARAVVTDDPCVLIIDEINRANLARVFGELMYLLEYRSAAIPLAGGERFSIPKNVYLPP